MSFFSRRVAESQPVAHPALEIPSYRQVLPRLMLEVERARRFEHPLTMVVVSPQAARLTHTRTGAFQPWVPASLEASPEAFPALFVRLGSILRAQLRTIDVLATTADAQSYLLGLVETRRLGGELLLERFRQGFRECTRVPLQAGVAEFPEDGMTLEDLLDHAWRERREHPAENIPGVRPSTTHG